MLIGSQAFQETPRQHAPAIVLAHGAASRRVGQLRSDERRSPPPAPSRAARSSCDGARPGQGVLYHGLEVLGGGAILAGLDPRRDRGLHHRPPFRQGRGGVRGGRRGVHVLRLHARRSASASARRRPWPRLTWRWRRCSSARSRCLSTAARRRRWRRRPGRNGRPSATEHGRHEMTSSGVCGG